jgi:hypothetical protein
METHMTYTFPPLTLANWQPTRDTLHYYTKVIGAVRKEFTPEQKHWWMGSLYVTPVGLTTGPVPIGSRSVQLTLNFRAHRLQLINSAGTTRSVRLMGQSEGSFATYVTDALEELGVPMVFRGAVFEGDGMMSYDLDSAETYLTALVQIDNLFKKFRASFRKESSPVHLFPHHFDLAVTWFSGRLVPDTDPTDPDYSDEQMTFGFVTGDRGIEDAYFYATAYPTPNELTDQPLPAVADWHTAGWTGAVLPYQALVEDEHPDLLLLNFLHTAHQAGERFMSG